MKVKCHACIGGTSIRDDLDKLKSGQQLIVGTPGRVSDMIQKRMTGKVTPEAFTHGTADQRVEWLRRGLSTGDPAACDTFNQ